MFIRFLLAGLFVVAAFRATNVQAAGPVVINELMWMGSSASTADEWIELRNVTDQPVDVSNWQLTKKSSGAEALMVTIPTGKKILPGGILLIGNYAETNANSSLAVTPDVVTTDVALSNTALQIKLYDAGHALIDTADDGSGNPLAGQYVSSAKTYASMERNPDPGDGTLVESWHTASRGAGFKPDRLERGTPGSLNSNGLPTALIDAPTEAVAGQTVNFDGSDSTDPERQPLNYTWDFGDGTMSNEATPTHVFVAAGEFAVALVVSDGIDTASASVKVTVIAPPPAAPPTTSTDDPAVPLSTAAVTSCRDVLLNELFVNPAGSDSAEFIELFNPTDQTLSLTGCAVSVNDRRRYTFPVGMTIAGKSWFVLARETSNLALTNSGATVRLLDVDGTEGDAVTYAQAEEDSTWSRYGQTWAWTATRTPGVDNGAPPAEDDETTTVSKPKSAAAKKTSTKKRTAAAKPIRSVSLTEVQNLESGERVRVTGVVTAPVGALGTRVTYLQDGQAAASLVLGENSRPLSIGDRISIVGTVRLYQGRKRISVKAGDTRLLQSGQAVEPAAVKMDDLTEGMADRLVHVSGLLSGSTGARLTIDDGSGQGEIYLKSSTGIIKPTTHPGDRVDVVGIVSVSTVGIRVLPRTKDDLRVERVLGAATARPTAPVLMRTASPRQTLWYWVFAALGGIVAGAGPAWKAWRSRKSKD